MSASRLLMMFCFLMFVLLQRKELLPFEELENLIHILKNTFNDFFFKTGFLKKNQSYID